MKILIRWWKCGGKIILSVLKKGEKKKRESRKDEVCDEVLKKQTKKWEVSNLLSLKTLLRKEIRNREEELSHLILSSLSLSKSLSISISSNHYLTLSSLPFFYFLLIVTTTTKSFLYTLSLSLYFYLLLLSLSPPSSPLIQNTLPLQSSQL